jgi:hypothetical protein
MTFGVDQSERNNVAVRSRDRNDIGCNGKNNLYQKTFFVLVHIAIISVLIEKTIHRNNIALLD